MSNNQSRTNHSATAFRQNSTKHTHKLQEKIFSHWAAEQLGLLKGPQWWQCRFTFPPRSSCQSGDLNWRPSSHKLASLTFRPTLPYTETNIPREWIKKHSRTIMREEARKLIGQEPISCFYSMRQLDVSAHPLDVMVVCRRVLPSIQPLMLRAKKGGIR